jgi:hypothetical protein
MIFSAITVLLVFMLLAFLLTSTIIVLLVFMLLAFLLTSLLLAFKFGLKNLGPGFYRPCSLVVLASPPSSCAADGPGRQPTRHVAETQIRPSEARDSRARPPLRDSDENGACRPYTHARARAHTHRQPRLSVAAPATQPEQPRLASAGALRLGLGGSEVPQLRPWAS